MTATEADLEVEALLAEVDAAAAAAEAATTFTIEQRSLPLTRISGALPSYF